MTDSNDPDRPYVVISTDGHAGADLLDYKPYLEQRYHDEFDAWAAGYRDPWGEIKSQQDRDHSDAEAPWRFGVASYDLTLNWDSAARLAYTESQGVVAEVLFPNTAPPFFPSNAIAAPGPRTAEDFERRSAGLRAHNRWLAEFCADTPGRRAGFAQVFLDDIDAAVAEIRWAKEAGLKGVLLPADNVQKMCGLYYRRLDPIWQVCAELDLPVHRHAIFTNEGVSESSAATWIGIVELPFFETRAVAHMICAGVFERFPDLKFVLTEVAMSELILGQLAGLDSMHQSAQLVGQPTFVTALVSEAASALKRRPSEYFATNCYMANPLDFRPAHEAGLPNIMFGIDLPHSEGCAPYTKEAMRLVFEGMSEHEVRTLTSLRAAEVYDFDLAELQKIANKVGFTPAEIGQPLQAAEMPRFAEQTHCFLFADSAANAVGRG